MRVRGSIIIELLWVVPVFFVLTGFLVWSALELNARTAVRSALFSGLRLAATRGNSKAVGKSTIEEIDSYLSSGTENERARQLLMSPDIDSRVPPHDMSSLYFETSLQPVFQGRPFQDRGLSALRTEYTYALLYTYLEIRSQLGGLASYPCDPRQPGGANCLQCRVLNPRPDKINLDQYADSIPAEELPFLGVRCTYLPADPLSKALAPLIAQSPSFWPIVEWDGLVSIFRHGYLDEENKLRFQDLG